MASGMVLSSPKKNKKQFFIPSGFLVLSDMAEFYYKCDDFYHANDEGGRAWNDPEIGVKWPKIVAKYAGGCKCGRICIRRWYEAESQ